MRISSNLVYELVENPTATTKCPFIYALPLVFLFRKYVHFETQKPPILLLTFLMLDSFFFFWGEEKINKLSSQVRRVVGILLFRFRLV